MTSSSRFPPDVDRWLRDSGWYPGRALPAADLDAYARRIHDIGVRSGRGPYRINDHARRFLTEFGGLTLCRYLAVHPRPEDPADEFFSFYEDWIGQAVTPVIAYLTPADETPVDEPDDDDQLEGEIVIAADGRAFGSFFVGKPAYYLGSDIEWALIVQLRGALVPGVYTDGTIEYRDYAGRPLDPAQYERPVPPNHHREPDTGTP